jgi:hypothetical protein
MTEVTDNLTFREYELDVRAGAAGLVELNRTSRKTALGHIDRPGSEVTEKLTGCMCIDES